MSVKLYDFSSALDYIKRGNYVRRLGWNGKGLAVGLVANIKGEPLLQPFFIIYNSNKGTYNTWVPSVSDLLAEDWIILFDKEEL